MIENDLIMHCCGKFPGGSSKSIITIDTNTTCSAEIDMTGKFFIYNASINISENKELIIVSIDFSNEPDHIFTMLYNSLNSISVDGNYITCEVEVLVKSKNKKDWFLATPYLWCAFKNNSIKKNDTIILISHKKDISIPIL